jgi:hypothetical protein
LGVEPHDLTREFLEEYGLSKGSKVRVGVEPPGRLCSEPWCENKLRVQRTQAWGSPTASVVGGPARQSGAWSTWLEIVVETKEYSHGAWECLIDKYL